MSELNQNIGHQPDAAPSTTKDYSIEGAVAGFNHLEGLAQNEPLATNFDHELAQLTPLPNKARFNYADTKFDLQLVLTKLNSDKLTDEQEIEITPEIESQLADANLSVASLKRYLNPVYFGKAYGRFVKRAFSEFGAAEGVGTASALAAGYIAHHYYGGGVEASAITGTVASATESVGFYGTSFVKRFRELRKEHEVSSSIPEDLAESGRYMLGAFTVAELIDAPFRTVAMTAVPAAFPGIGTVGGLFGAQILSNHVYLGIAEPSARAHKKRSEVRRAKKQAKRDEQEPIYQPRHAR